MCIFFNKIAVLMPANLLKKETLALVFPFEFYEIFRNTFFIKHFWWLLLIFEENYVTYLNI